MSQREYFGFRGSADEAGEVRVRTNVSGTSTRLLLQSFSRSFTFSRQRQEFLQLLYGHSGMGRTCLRDLRKFTQGDVMKTHKARMLLRVVAALAVAVAGDNLAQAQTCSVTWTGNAGDGLWSTAGNWSPSHVPGSTSDICIPTLRQATATPPISIHSLQISEGGSLIIESGKGGASFSIATSLSNTGGIQTFGDALSAGSIDMPNPGNITAYDNSSITGPALSNSTGTLSVGTGGTLRLADNPVQLQNGNLSGGNWEVSGVLVIPSDISQITTQSGAAFGTVVTVDGSGSAVQTSGHNALATLTSVGSGSALVVFDGASLTVGQGLTSEGVVDVGSGSRGSLTVNGTYTQATGATTNMSAGTLSATSVTVESKSTLQGNGTVTSSVTNNGTVGPQGSLTVTGNYTQTSGGALNEQFGSTLHVNGNATLSGYLFVRYGTKVPRKSGSTYTAMTFSSLSGEFTNVSPGTAKYTNNSVVVKFP